MLLEAYTPDQLKFKTGGPPSVEMMMDSQCLTREMVGLEVLYLEEKIREVHEGRFHNGEGAVVQLLAKKQ